MTLVDLLDLYALAGERSHEVVRRFRDRWLTSFEPSAEEYEFPQYSDRPDAVYSSPWELIDRLLAAPEQPHSLYWRNPRPGHELHAMLFFTTDGGLITGLTVATDDPNRAGTTLRRLAQRVDARYGYATWEEPPPDTTPEFKTRARTAEIQLLPTTRERSPHGSDATSPDPAVHVDYDCPVLGLSSPDIAAIRAAEDALAEAFEASDRTAWVDFYTEDAIFVGPGMPAIEGRAALLDVAREIAISSMEITADSTIGAGDFAATLGRGNWVSGPKGSDAPTLRRRFLMVWRRERDGRWRIARELLNEDV